MDAQFVILQSSSRFELCDIGVFGNLTNNANYKKNIAEKKPTFFSCSNQSAISIGSPSNAVDGSYSNFEFTKILSNIKCDPTYWAVSLIQIYLLEGVVIIKDKISKI